MNKNELARDVFIKLVTAGKVSKHPVGIGHKLNVHKTFNLRRESTGRQRGRNAFSRPASRNFSKAGEVSWN